MLFVAVIVIILVLLISLLALRLDFGYNASYVLVFTPDDLQKFAWIAKIAGYNATLTASPI